MAISDLNIDKDASNRMLKRREMTVSFSFSDATPSRAEIKKVLADKFNLKQENMVVVRSEQLYGTRKGTALIHEYQDADAMKVAQKHTTARPNPKKGAAAAPKSDAAAKPEAAPAAAAPKEKGEKKAEEAKKA